MKVLVVGSGGREHVLAWKIKQSTRLTQLFCAPGNGGIAEIAECVDIAATDIPALVAFAKNQNIDLTVVGPEAPLVAGIVDVFEAEGLRIFGPRRNAARLEGSKIFSKEFMRRCNIPTAAFNVFSDAAAAREFLAEARFPLVIKADGLAAGKGVFVCPTSKETGEALQQIMEDRVFDEAGNQVVIEECLEGEEVSILALSDGEHYTILDSSQDHKRIFDDDIGPNTGGMGAYSPAPVVKPDVMAKIDKRIIEPAIRGMQREGEPFKGVLYAGLMLTLDGPKVLEFNVRFGDPEAQAVIPRMKGDFLDILCACCDGNLPDAKIRWAEKSCVCVVMSSGGYPGEYETGKAISGLGDVGNEDTIVFHAGTKLEGDKIVTTGGRVLGVTSLGHGIGAAIERAYEAVEKIKFDRCFFRRDIGARAYRRSQSRLSRHIQNGNQKR